MGGRASGVHRPRSFEDLAILDSSGVHRPRSCEDLAIGERVIGVNRPFSSCRDLATAAERTGSVRKARSCQDLATAGRAMAASGMLPGESSESVQKATLRAEGQNTRSTRRVPRRHLLLKQLAEAGETDAELPEPLQLPGPAGLQDSDSRAVERLPELAELQDRELMHEAMEPESRAGLREADSPAKDDDDCEFELWVEAEMDASWCLEDTSGRMASTERSSQSSAGAWKADCSTSCLRRRWDDFEALGTSNHTLQSEEGKADESAGGNAFGRAGFCHEAALLELGLPPDTKLTSQLLASAFRQRSLICHPDKAGTLDDFNRLVAAYKGLTESLEGR